MKTSRTEDEMRPEYDLEKLGKGVKGKYHDLAVAGTNHVMLDPDVAAVFPDADSVNRALRLLIQIAASNVPSAKGSPRRPAPSRSATTVAETTSAPPARRSAKPVSSRPGSSSSGS
jgi:hypothetical protein